MTAFVQTISDFIVQHPHWAALLVFMTAAGEAIAVVGALIPGTTILISVGAVVGLGHLPLWPILTSATLGAIAGDGLSYWLGHRYGHHIIRIWPFSRRPELLSQGEAFLRRHGGKAVVIGRFLPVTRAVVPLVAGVMGMNPVRFYLANVLSAAAWAPLHILPGVVFGGFLTLIGGISGRLLAVFLGFLFFVAAVVWLLKIAVMRLIPLLARLLGIVVSWAQRKPGFAAKLIMSTVNPSNPDARTFLALGILAVGSFAGFLAILEDVATRDSIVLFDRSVSHFVQTLRTTWSDDVMVAITMLGDIEVSATVATVIIVWLTWCRQWRLALGYASTLAFAALSVWSVKTALHLPRPITVTFGLDGFSFPSGHATMTTVLYGMLAWLASNQLSGRRRVLPLIGAGGLIGLIAASRVYLAAHWPSDVAAGLLLGFGLTAVFGLVFRRVDTANLRPLAFGFVVSVAFLAAGFWHVMGGFEATAAIYAQKNQTVTISRQAWLDGGWSRLAENRRDLDGEQEETFVLQWAGTASQLERKLLAAGWRSPPSWSVLSATSFASAVASAGDLPVLPLFHDGRKPSITLIKSESNSESRRVFRAWPSDVNVSDGEGSSPLLLGSFREEKIERPWGLASVTMEVAFDEIDAAYSLATALSGKERNSATAAVRRTPQAPQLLLAGP